MLIVSEIEEERGNHKGGRRLRPLLSHTQKGSGDPEIGREIRVRSAARQGEPGEETACILSGPHTGRLKSVKTLESPIDAGRPPHRKDCQTAFPRKATHRTVREPQQEQGQEQEKKEEEEQQRQGYEGCLRHKYVYAADKAEGLPGKKMGSRPKIPVIGPEIKIGIDPARHTSMVVAINKNGRRLFRRVLSHNKRGMQRLVDSVEQLHTETGAEIEILIEASSFFWQTTYQSLCQAKTKRGWSWAVVCIISSKATAMSRKTQQREVGSDGRDAYLIADMGFGHHNHGLERHAYRGGSLRPTEAV